MKIAICITTTPNRKAICDETIAQWMLVAPQGSFFYVHNDSTYKGVSYSKNKCLQWSEFADYVFCFDDDIWPVTVEFAERYIYSGLEHAAYTFNRTLIAKHESKYLLRNPPINVPAFNEYEKPNGCMLFFTRKCIDTCGGWDIDFKGYGYEHVSLSDRIFNIGLTPARYVDVPNSNGLFTMADCESSFTAQDRAMIPHNYELYQQKYYSKEFKPFK